MNRRVFYVLGAALLYLLALTMAVAAAGRVGPDDGVAADRQARLAQGPPSGRSSAPAAYAGEATCLSCHDDRSYRGTAHGHAFSERTPAANQGCERP